VRLRAFEDDTTHEVALPQAPRAHRDNLEARTESESSRSHREKTEVQVGGVRCRTRGLREPDRRATQFDASDLSTSPTLLVATTRKPSGGAGI